MPSGSAVFSVDSTFTVHPGIAEIVVELWGGGGGGGLGTNTDIWGGGSAGSAGSGGGGGSGGYTKATLSVMSVSACWITVGAGGIGAVSDQGGWGGNSMISCGIDSPQYADGGGGGWPGSELGGGAGGAGGVGNTLAGNPGHTGYSGGFSTPGGFGGAPVTGIVPPTRSAGEGGLGGMVGFGVGHPGSDGLVVVHW